MAHVFCAGDGIAAKDVVNNDVRLERTDKDEAIENEERGGAEFEERFELQRRRKTATEIDEIQSRTGEDIIACFVPTTPNPTSGFIIVVPKRDVIELDMEVDEAVKLIMSLGVVVPSWSKAQTAELPLKIPEPE